VSASIEAYLLGTQRHFLAGEPPLRAKIGAFLTVLHYFLAVLTETLGSGSLLRPPPSLFMPND